MCNKNILACNLVIKEYGIYVLNLIMFFDNCVS